jgi:hypothetical protein
MASMASALAKSLSAGAARLRFVVVIDPWAKL